MKIASRQRQELDHLRETIKNIEGFVGSNTRQNFRDLSERLDHWAAKVAVIGQVKAGKSTFLNAFLHQQDLLPADVNPWTTVVTNIRINMPQDPVTGARFEFFAESDWEEIVSGTSKIRKLTEELLPGFDTELLKKQSEEMRERAERRLGQHYKTLLGSHHDYDFFTSDLMQRYVCAGAGADDGLEREALGRYASLTKVANVYMRLPDFQVPTILTDTPGVNDPFLVRDEFTCRSLDQSDVFVMALSANQPLTEVDISLIRILAKQESKDVLIYVNRIDELDNYATQSTRVVKDVEARLKKAIPELEFTIVSGSAYFAELTMRTDEDAQEERDDADTPELAAYLQTRYGHVPEDQDERLYLGSGLADVKAELSDLIDRGVGQRHIGQLFSDLRAELGAAQFVTRRERESLMKQIETINGDAMIGHADRMQGEINEIEGLYTELEAHVESANDQLEKLITKHWSQLEAKCLEYIDDFVADQKTLFEELILRSDVTGSHKKAVEVDTLPLQLKLGREVGKSFDKSRAATDVILNNHLHACRQSVGDQFDEEASAITLDNLPFNEFTSTLALAKRSLKIDIVSERNWAFWKGPTVDINKSIQALRVIAAAELRPATDKLLSAFNEAQVTRAEAGMGRIQTMLRMIDVSLSERTHRLQRTRADYEQIAKDTELQQRLIARIQSQMEVLERRLLNLSAIEGALTPTDQAQVA